MRYRAVVVKQWLSDKSRFGKHELFSDRFTPGFWYVKI